MKVIELLNKIANGEEVPEKIKYREMIYHICYEYGDYESDIEEYRFADTKEHYYLFEDIDMLKCLNDEVEVIEDKKIEKIYHCCMESKNDEVNILVDNNNTVVDKLNEIIDKINKMEDK